jgi:hypothetical protein
MDEWIQHYKLRGVDHIYLVNDFSTDNFISIIDKYGDYITLFNNDIVTKDINRQCSIYDKYFRPILNTSKWISILDMDEFLYSPIESNFTDILEKYKNFLKKDASYDAGVYSLSEVLKRDFDEIIKEY